MKWPRLLLPALSLFGIMASTTSALADPVTIADITSFLSASNSTESGRLSRSGIPSTFGSEKAFPGLINPGVSYSYTTFTFAPSLFAGGQNVEVSFFDQGDTGSLFASAYAGTYNPANPQTNYLGDLGYSPNDFGNDAGYFEFVLPQNTGLTILVNETLGGANSALIFGDPFELVVQHSATDFTGDPYGDPVPHGVTPTPEPSSLLLLGTGALGMLGLAKKRFFARAGA